MGTLGSSYRAWARSRSPVQATRDIAKLFVTTAGKLYKLQAERDSSNNARQNILPPVTLKELIVLATREFNPIVLQQRERLLSSWSENTIERIQADFRDLSLVLFTTKIYVTKLRIVLTRLGLWTPGCWCLAGFEHYSGSLAVWQRPFPELQLWREVSRS